MNFINELKSFRSLKNYNYKPKTYKELLKILEIKANNKDVNLNDIDVILLDKINGFNVFNFFEENNFYVDEWDVSNVKDFSFCFFNCRKFNCDLSNWDVSNGIDLSNFFSFSIKFNQNINHFNLFNAEYVGIFLSGAKSFNQPLDRFKFNYKIKSLWYFFRKCFNFNQDISMWDVSNIEDFSYMFYYAKNFLQDLSNWNVSNAKNWECVFHYSEIKKHIELIPEKFRLYYIK